MTRNIQRGLLASAAALCAAAGSVAVGGTAFASSSKSQHDRRGDAAVGSVSLTETGSTLLYPLWNLWVPGYTGSTPT